MQTRLIPQLLNEDLSRQADDILRKCVHCGFCNSACPTYQLDSNELDGPRGRIYQIKTVLEGERVSPSHLHHLDRCLECQACETACPSGVRYTRLLEIGRPYIAAQVRRTYTEIIKRFLALRILPYASRVKVMLAVARRLQSFFPQSVACRIPAAQKTPSPELSGNKHRRRILMLGGCVQAAVSPQTNAHCRYLLDKLGIETIEIPNACCGALPYHIGDHQRAYAMIIKNIERLQSGLDSGAEAIVSTASGCGNMLKSYLDVLPTDSPYLTAAERVSALHKDVSEVIADECANNPLAKELHPTNEKVVFQTPCTLRHGQGLAGKAESILAHYGVVPVAPEASDVCCGSAGYYSLAQTQIANRLRDRKLQSLLTSEPDVILTANIGCQMHLQSASPIPVKHWIHILH